MKKINNKIFTFLMMVACVFGLSACQPEEVVEAIETQFVYDSFEIELRKEYDVFGFLDKQLTEKQQSYLDFKVADSSVAYVTPAKKLVGVNYGSTVLSVSFQGKELDTMAIELIEFKNQLENPVNLKYDFSTHLFSWSYEYCEVNGSLFSIPEYEIEYIRTLPALTEAEETVVYPKVVERVIGDNTFSFSERGNYKIRVRTIAPSANYISSEFATDAQGQPQYFEINLMAAPNNLVYDDRNSILSWNANGNPSDTEYIVHYKFNGQAEKTKRVEITSCVFDEPIEFGVHEAYVEVVQHDNYYANASEKIVLTKLKTPEITFNNGMISWGAVQNAVAYKFTLTYNGGKRTETTLYTETNLALHLPAGECAVSVIALSNDSPTTFDSKPASKSFTKLPNAEISYNPLTNEFSVTNNVIGGVAHGYEITLIKTLDQSEMAVKNLPFRFSDIDSTSPYAIRAQLFAKDASSEIDSEFCSSYRIDGEGSNLLYIQNLNAPELYYYESEGDAFIEFTEIDENCNYQIFDKVQELEISPTSEDLVFTYELGKVNEIFADVKDYQYTIKINKNTTNTFFVGTSTSLRVSKIRMPETVGLVNDTQVAITDIDVPSGVATFDLTVNGEKTNYLNMTTEVAGEQVRVDEWNITAKYIADTSAYYLDQKTYYTSSEANTFTIKRLNSPTSLNFDYSTKTFSYAPVEADMDVYYNIYRNNEMVVAASFSTTFLSSVVGSYSLSVEAIPEIWSYIEHGEIGYYKSATNSIDILKTENLTNLRLSKNSSGIITAEWDAPNNAENFGDDLVILYDVYIDSELVQANLSETSFTFASGAFSATDYEYTIKVVLHSRDTGPDQKFFDKNVQGEVEVSMLQTVNITRLGAPSYLSRSGNILTANEYSANKMLGMNFNGVFKENTSSYEFEISEGETVVINASFSGIFDQALNKYYLSSTESVFTIKKLTTITNLDFEIIEEEDESISFEFTWDSTDLNEENKLIPMASFAYSSMGAEFNGFTLEPFAKFTNVNMAQEFTFYVTTIANRDNWTEIYNGSTEYLSCDNVVSYDVFTENAVTEHRLSYDKTQGVVNVSWQFDPKENIVQPTVAYVPYFTIELLNSAFEVTETINVLAQDCLLTGETNKYGHSYDLSLFDIEVTENTFSFFRVFAYSNKTLTSFDSTISLVKLAPVEALTISDENAFLVDSFGTSVIFDNLNGVVSIEVSGGLSQSLTNSTTIDFTDIDANERCEFEIYYKAIAPNNVLDGSYYLDSDKRKFVIQRLNNCNLALNTDNENIYWSEQVYTTTMPISYTLKFEQNDKVYTYSSITDTYLSLKNKTLIDMLADSYGEYDVYGKVEILGTTISPYTDTNQVVGYISGRYGGDWINVYKVQSVASLNVTTDVNDKYQDYVTISWNTVADGEVYSLYLSSSLTDFESINDSLAPLAPTAVFVVDVTDPAAPTTLSYQVPKSMLIQKGVYYVTMQVSAKAKIISNVTKHNNSQWTTIVRFQDIDQNAFVVDADAMATWSVPEHNAPVDDNLNFLTYYIEIWMQETTTPDEEDSQEAPSFADEEPETPATILLQLSKAKLSQELLDYSVITVKCYTASSYLEGQDLSGTSQIIEVTDDAVLDTTTYLGLQWTDVQDVTTYAIYFDTTLVAYYVKCVPDKDKNESKDLSAFTVRSDLGESEYSYAKLSENQTTIDFMWLADSEAKYYNFISDKGTVLGTFSPNDNRGFTGSDLEGTGAGDEVIETTGLVLKYTFGTKLSPITNSFLNLKEALNGQVYADFIKLLNGQSFVMKIATIGLGEAVNGLTTLSSRQTTINVYRLLAPDVSVQNNKLVIRSNDIDNSNNFSVKYYYTLTSNETGDGAPLVNNREYIKESISQFELGNSATEYYVRTYATVSSLENPNIITSNETIHTIKRLASPEDLTVEINDPSDTAQSAVKLSWKPVVNATGYDVYVVYNYDLMGFTSTNSQHISTYTPTQDEILTDAPSAPVPDDEDEESGDGKISVVLNAFDIAQTYDVLVVATSENEAYSPASNVVRVVRLNPVQSGYMTADKVVHFTTAYQEVSDNKFNFELLKIDSSGSALTLISDSITMQVGTTGAVDADGNKILDFDPISPSSFTFSGFVNNEKLAEFEGGTLVVRIRVIGNGGIDNTQNGVITLSSSLMSGSLEGIEVLKLYNPLISAGLDKLLFNFDKGDITTPNGSGGSTVAASSYNIFSVFEGTVTTETIMPDNEEEESGDEGTQSGTEGEEGEENTEQPQPTTKRTVTFDKYAQGSIIESYMTLKNIVATILDQGTKESGYSYPENWLPGEYKVIAQTIPNDGILNVLASNESYKYLYRLNTPNNIKFMREAVTNATSYSSDANYDEDQYVNPNLFIQFDLVTDAVRYMFENDIDSIQGIDIDEEDTVFSMSINERSGLENILYQGTHDSVHNISLYAWAGGDISPVTSESEAYEEGVEKFAISSPRVTLTYTYLDKVQNFGAKDGITKWDTQLKSSGYIARANWQDKPSTDDSTYSYWETLDPAVGSSLLTGIAANLNNIAPYPDGSQFVVNIKAIGNVTTTGVSAVDGTALLDGLFRGEGEIKETFLKIPTAENVTTYAGFITFDPSYRADSYYCEIYDAETNTLIVSDILQNYCDVLGYNTQVVAYSPLIYSNLLTDKLYYMIIQARSSDAQVGGFTYNILYADMSEKLYFKILENPNLDPTDITLNTPVVGEYYDLAHKQISGYVSANSYGVLKLTEDKISALTHNAAAYTEKTRVSFDMNINEANAGAITKVTLASMGSTGVAEAITDTTTGITYYYLSSSFTTSQGFDILGGTRVYVEDGVIKWTGVESADGYYVYLNGNSVPYSDTLIRQVYLDLPSSEGGLTNVVKHIDVIPVSLEENVLQGPVAKYQVKQNYSNLTNTDYIDLLKLHTPDLFGVQDGALKWLDGIKGLSSFDQAEFDALSNKLRTNYSFATITEMENYIANLLDGPITIYSKYSGFHKTNLIVSVSGANGEFSFSIDGLRFLSITTEQYNTLDAVFTSLSGLCDEILRELMQRNNAINLTAEKMMYVNIEQNYDSLEELLYARVYHLKQCITINQQTMQMLNAMKTNLGFPSFTTFFEELSAETRNVRYGEYSITVQQIGNNFDFLNSSVATNGQKIYIPAAPEGLEVFSDADNNFYLSWYKVDIPSQYRYEAKLNANDLSEEVVYILYGEDANGKRYELSRTIGEPTASDNKLKISLTDLIEQDKLTPDIVNIYLIVAGNNEVEATDSVRFLNGIKSQQLKIEVLDQLTPSMDYGTLVLSTNITGFGYQIKAYAGENLEVNKNLAKEENTWIGDELTAEVQYLMKIRAIGYVYVDDEIGPISVLTSKSFSFDLIKLETQQISVNKYGIFVWEKVNNATGFMVVVNDSEDPYYVCTDPYNSTSYESDCEGFNNYKFRALGSNGAIRENGTYYAKSHINNSKAGLNAVMLSSIDNITVKDGLIQFTPLDATYEQNVSNLQNGLEKYIGYRLTFSNGGGDYYSTELDPTVCATIAATGKMFFDFTNYGHAASYTVTIQPYVYFADSTQELVGQTRKENSNTDYYQLLGVAKTYDFEKIKEPTNIKIYNGEFVWDGQDGDQYYIVVYDASGTVIHNAVTTENKWWADENSPLNSQDRYSISIKEYREGNYVFSVFTKYADIHGVRQYFQKLTMSNLTPGNASDENGNYITFDIASQGSEVGFNLAYKINDETEFSYLTVNDANYNDVVTRISNTVRINVNKLREDIITMDYKLQLVTLRESLYLKSNYSDLLTYSTPDPLETVYFDEESLEYYFTYIDNKSGFIIKDELLVNETDEKAFVTYYYRILPNDLTNKNYYKLRTIDGRTVGTISYMLTADGYYHRVSVAVSANPNSATSNISPYTTCEVIHYFDEFKSSTNIFAENSIMFTNAELSQIEAYVLQNSFGNANNPYLISSKDDLEMLNKRLYFYDYLSSYTLIYERQVGYYMVTETIDINTGLTAYEFKQTDDISDVTTPIGKRVIKSDNTPEFVGFGNVYDGNGKTISYVLTLDNTPQNAYYRLGLFLQLEKNATVKNLHILANVDFDGRTDSTVVFGSAVGYNYGKVSNVSISSITVQNLMKNRTGVQVLYFGGAVGYNDGGVIEDVIVTNGDTQINLTSTVSGGYIYVGGITPRNYSGGKITRSGNNVSFVVSSVMGAYVGGVVGFNDGEISECYNTGNISATCSSTSAITYLSGLVAYNNGSIFASYVTDITVESHSTSSSIYAGGIAGYTSNRNISCCFSMAEQIVIKKDAGGNITAYGGTLFGVILAGTTNNNNVNYYVNDFAVSDRTDQGDFARKVDISTITLLNTFVNNINNRCGEMLFDIKDNKLVLVWEIE